MSDLNDGDEVLFYLERGDAEMMIRVVIDRRHRPKPRPRDITSIYETNTVKLGFGENFIQVQALDSTHELYDAGLRADDVILEINGDNIDALNNLFADDSIDLTVERGNDMLNINVPTSVAPLLMFGVDAPQTQETGEWLGLHEKQVTLGVRYIQLEEDSIYFGESGVSNGAFIAEVIAGLPAAQAGVEVGDIIVSINDVDTSVELDLRNVIYAHQPGDIVTLEVLRNGEIIKIDVTLRVATS